MRAVVAAAHEVDVAVDLVEPRVGAAGPAVQPVDVLRDDREPLAERRIPHGERAVPGVGLGRRHTPRRYRYQAQTSHGIASNELRVASSCGWYSRAPTVQ